MSSTGTGVGPVAGSMQVRCYTHLLTLECSVSSRPLPAFEAVQAALVALALGVDADEVHGSLCGYLSGGGEGRPTGWPEQLALDAVDAAALSVEQPLGQLFTSCVAQIADDQLSFQLLLPEHAPLSERADALLQWCRGFLGGFGLARGRTNSEDAAEALADLGRIAGTVVTFEDPEQDEQSLQELIEFVRVAVLLLNDDRRDRDDPPTASPHPSRLH